jgi:hypothetical protein
MLYWVCGGARFQEYHLQPRRNLQHPALIHARGEQRLASRRDRQDRRAGEPGAQYESGRGGGPVIAGRPRRGGGLEQSQLWTADKVINHANLTKSAEELFDLWNAEHPDDQVED